MFLPPGSGRVSPGSRRGEKEPVLGEVVGLVSLRVLDPHGFRSFAATRVRSGRSPARFWAASRDDGNEREAACSGRESSDANVHLGMFHQDRPSVNAWRSRSSRQRVGRRVRIVAITRRPIRADSRAAGFVFAASTAVIVATLSRRRTYTETR